MGGKNKQSQRTKNNVRPSSSGRSAELLSSAGKLDASMAVVGGKLMPALFPALAAVTLDAGLDPELAMCIKKLNKKDPITKTKALQELTELVNKSSVEDVEAALPGWSHFYKTLSVDIDCKVRECTQVCHGAIVRVCGRRIAPHLKQLLPSWLQAQYDDYAPAQAQAQLSLKNTFPDAKLPEVIAFCKTEILDFLEDNLTGKSALAAAADEAEGGRGVAAALHGLAWSVRHAPRGDDWLGQRVGSLLAGDGFWRLAAHKQCPVRGAWFAAMGSIVERFATSMDAKCGTRLLRVLLGTREADTRVAAQLWGCLLICMHNVPDWHAWLDKKDLLAKRIINLLETGGWGDARQLSSTLLPLLASLPPDMLTNQFYEQFFKAVFAGLEKKSVINSKSERQAWITGLSECMRYVSAQPLAGGPELCSAAHRRWLQCVLTAQHEPQLATGLLKHSAITMTELLKYWLRRAREEDGERYSSLVRNFWQNIGATVCQQSTGLAPEPAAMLAQRHVLFLTTVRQSFAHDQRRQHSIRFDGDEPTLVEPASPGLAPAAGSAELFLHHWAAAAELASAHYLQLASDARAPDVILPPLSPLLTSLSRPALESVAQRLDAVSIYGLFEKVLLPWLKDKGTRCEPVMDLVFQLLGHMTEEEQDATFAAFTQEPVCTWALWRALSHPHVSRVATRRWLRGAAVSRAVAAAARDTCSGAAGRARELLLRATTPADDEMLVSEETVTSVVDILVEALSSQCAEPLSSVLAQLATTLAQRPPANYRKLLLALFRLNLTQHRGSDQLSLSAWLEARGSWQDGLHALSPAPRAALRAHAAAMLLRAALPSATLDDVDIPSIEHATSLCPYLLSDCERAAPDAAETVDLIQQLFEPARKLVENSAALDIFALRHDCIVSRLSCPFADDNDAIAKIVKDCDQADVDELTKQDLTLRLSELVFRALCLRTLLLHRPDDDDCSSDAEHSWCSVLLADERVQAELCALLRDYVVLGSLHDGYAFWPHYEIVERVKSKLDVAIQDIIDETPVSLRQTILLLLSERAAKEGYYWAYARSCYEAKSTERSEDQSADKSDAGSLVPVNMDNLAEVITGNGLYHSLQANLRWLPSPPSPAADEDSSPPSPLLRTAHVVMLRAAMSALEASSAPQDIRQQFASDAVSAAQAGTCDPDVMVDLYYRHEKVMLGDRDPLQVSWQTVVCSAAVAEYLAVLVAERGWRAAPHHWDFATITLCALLAALQKQPCTKTAMLCVSSLRLLHSVRTFIEALPRECERRQPAPHVAALMDEWKDIFAPDIHTNLFNVIMKTLDNPPAGPTSCIAARTLSALTSAARSLQWRCVPAALRSDALSLRRAARRCAAALACAAHRGYKYLAHATLTALASDLVLEDADKLAAWSERSSTEEEDASPAPPPALTLTYFHDHYRSLLELLDVALANITVGESSCEMAVGSDSRGVALGALLLCDALHAVCGRARGDLTHHYIQIFREEKYTDLLLTCAMRLLPAEVFAFALDNNSTQPMPERLVELFTTSRQYSVDEPECGSCGGVGDVGALACRGVFLALGGPGQAAARAAWAAWGARAGRALARLAAAAVAPQLLKDQFQKAAKRAKTLVDTEITLLPAAREAQAVHTVEDQPLRLTVTFSREHPLSPPRVQTPLVGPAAGAHWLLVYLGYQNGDLFSAVSLWVSALGAKIDRAPQCYICYCRLHPGEGVLPKVFCVQCKNKFHNACLRKWFTTSKKSNCPVCRAMF